MCEESSEENREPLSKPSDENLNAKCVLWTEATEGKMVYRLLDGFIPQGFQT